MVVGKLLFETAKQLAPRIQKGYDLLYAVGVGTAIGIGSNPDVRQVFEYYKGKPKMGYRDKFTRRRFKGDVYIDESSNTQQEAYQTDKPINRGPGSRRNYNVSYSDRRSPNYTKSRRRRCDCESVLRRILGKPRFSKRRR